MVVGYMAWGRSFAYLGIPQINVFIGEMYIAAFMFARFGRVWFEIAPRSPHASGRGIMTLLEDYRFILTIFACYGVLCVARGFLKEYLLMTSLQCFVYHAYALYLIPALWIGLHRPDWLTLFVRWLSRIQGVYGLLYIAFLSSTNIMLPFKSMPLFSQPIGGAVAVLLLLAIPQAEPKTWVRSLSVLANLAVMLGMQVRAEWLGFGLGLVVLTVLYPPSRRAIFTFVGVFGLLMGIAAITDMKMEAPSGRGGEISARGIAGRIIAAVDAKTAAKYVDNADDVAGTIDWRKNWWREIWKSVVVKGDNATFFFGHGYGFPLTDLVNYIDAEEGVRTPHNIFFYNLAYCGWVGVATSAMFQAVLVFGLWRAYRITGSAVGLVFWIVEIGVALFSNYLETPCGAIPFYTVIGVCLAPTLRPPPVKPTNPSISINERALAAFKRRQPQQTRPTRRPIPRDDHLLPW